MLDKWLKTCKRSVKEQNTVKQNLEARTSLSSFYKVGILKLRFVQFLGMAPHTAKG